MKQGKVWGMTSEVFSHSGVSVHRISVNKGGACSKHRHDHKYNTFFVESGQLAIDVWKNDYDLIDQTILRSGERMDVKPMEFHRFVAEEDTIAYEIYWTHLDEDDITREGHGSAE